MTESDLVLKERDGAILVLTLNAPEQRNPISELPMIDALSAALLAADADPETRVVILTGSGKAFSAGGNIKKMGAGSGLRGVDGISTRQNYRNGIQRLPLLFQSIDIPVIAAVNGPAIGAGCDLACMCDLRIGSTAASFAESFVKLGLIAGDGGAWLLPRIVGFSRACEMALTGDAIDAAQALAYGLVSKVVSPDALLAEARALALRIAANPTHATRMTKRLLREGQTATLQSVLELSAALQALSHETGDHARAMAAMLEKGTKR